MSRCRALATKTMGKLKSEFASWSLIADWSATYATFDNEYTARQLEMTATMAEGGLFYRKMRPVVWSPASRTALADSELEYNPEHKRFDSDNL